jgi:hypothetical protein
VTFFKNYLDAESAKAAIMAAYRTKYPDRVPLAVGIRDIKHLIFYVLQTDTAERSWWSIVRPEFTAIEIEPPANWAQPD